MIIWWLFDDYLNLIILDYSMIIWSKLFVIIWWLFDFWASSRLVGLLHSQKHSHGTAWWWQPFACANHSLRFSPATCCRSYGSTGTSPNHPLQVVFHDDFDPPSALPRSARRVFLQEVLDPAITQYLTVSSTQLTNLVCYGVAFFLPCVIRGYASNL